MQGIWVQERTRLSLFCLNIKFVNKGKKNKPWCYRIFSITSEEWGNNHQNYVFAIYDQL